MSALWWWLAAFGIWPLAHPEHDTFSSLTTLIDLTLHIVGFSVVLPLIVRWAIHRDHAAHRGE